MSKAAKDAMAASYKSLKEDFVSGLTGGDISEINLVTAVAPVGYKSSTKNNSNTNNRQRLCYGQCYNRDSHSSARAHL